MSKLTRPVDAVLGPYRRRTSPDTRRRLLWLAASVTLLVTMWTQTKDEISGPEPADAPPPD